MPLPAAPPIPPLMATQGERHPHLCDTTHSATHMSATSEDSSDSSRHSVEKSILAAAAADVTEGGFSEPSIIPSVRRHN